ncbi:MAG: hypothetical protein AB1540_08730 [Bdellovibrionota bacterium]
MDLRFRPMNSIRLVAPFFFVLCLPLLSACSKSGEILQGLGQPSSPNAPGEASFVVEVVEALQDRLVLIQNADGGWDWSSLPDELENSTQAETEHANMFGVNALGVLDAHRVTQKPAARAAVEKTVSALMAKPLSRTKRLYSSDCELLVRAGQSFQDSTVRDKGYACQVVEKEFFAAIHLLGKTSPQEKKVEELTQQQIDSVTDTQLALAARARSISMGRTANLRAFDWTSRMRVALERGDTRYHRAFAEVVAMDYHDLSVEKDWFLLGLAATISNLISLRSEAQFEAIVEEARIRLLGFQKESGLFEGVSSNGSKKHGSIQDQAFIARALIALNEKASLLKLAVALKNKMLPSGNFIESDGKETPETESELLTSLVLYLEDKN